MPLTWLSSENPVFEFNQRIIEATWDLVCGYKPNLAFYEALGTEGIEALWRTVEFLPTDMPIILDFKAGDIDNSAANYAKAAFEVWGFDAVTVNPYMGTDSIDPFMAYQDRCTFVLIRTSNRSASQFQDLMVDGEPLYRRVARELLGRYNSEALGLVVGATAPAQLADLRSLAPRQLILVPGIGAQGGDAGEAVKAGLDEEGGGLIVAASRAIIYASGDRDFPQQARRKALELRDLINKYRGR
jgi:orotidine 5'-phosphate decarboxylase subfamily 2